jgi:hypothetical protein
VTETPWVENNDGTLSCSACGCASFRPGHSCQCSAGGSPANSESWPVQTEASHAEISAGEPSVTFPLRTAADYERDLDATLRAQRRLRAAINKAPVEDEYVKSDDGRRGTWRQAWQAEHSKLRMRLDAIDKERKTLVDLHRMAHERELPELVEEMKRVNASIRRRESRLAKDPGVQ